MSVVQNDFALLTNSLACLSDRDDSSGQLHGQLAAEWQRQLPGKSELSGDEEARHVQSLWLSTTGVWLVR